MLATKYETKEKFIQLIPKEEIKRKLNGRSPDHADSASMAYFQFQSMPGEILKDKTLDFKTYTSELKY